MFCCLGDYTEAGPWQFRFYLPWNPTGLAELYASGGFDMCQELQRAQTIRPVFHIGGYGSLIHEMTEMTDVGQGQYAHNNQPSHHMLWMFGAIDPKGYTGKLINSYTLV